MTIYLHSNGACKHCFSGLHKYLLRSYIYIYHFLNPLLYKIDVRHTVDPTMNDSMATVSPFTDDAAGIRHNISGKPRPFYRTGFPLY